MVENNPNYNRAIERNLNELERSLSYRNGINELIKVAPTTRWTFFSYAYLAMYDQMISHAIKILDKDKEAASFWYIWRCNQKEVEKFLLKQNLSFDEVNRLSQKLKDIRDKTHFHIDKSEIFDPNTVWERADITGDYFNKVMDNLWNVYKDLYFDQFGKQYIQPIYNGNDIGNIIKAVQEKGITI